MAENGRSVFSNLIELSQIDSSLVLILSQKKSFEAELAQLKDQIVSQEQTVLEHRKSLEAQKQTYSKEESRLKSETDRLVERRRALQSFNNHKVQLAAQKEIEQAAKQISMQEEKLLGTLDQSTDLEARLVQEEKDLSELNEKLQTRSKEIEDELLALNERSIELGEKRKEMLQSVSEDHLVVYQRVVQRFPQAPLALISEGVCGGCFVQVPAQILVQVSRADGLIKCRGCGRILYLEQQASQAAPA